MANFPTSLHTKLTLTDNVDDVLASHPNTLSDELYATQVKVGVDNSTDITSIDYFLKHASGAYRTHAHDGTSDDGSASIGPLTGLTIANNVDVGNYQIRALQFYADATTGTAPLVVDSTTIVTNLNADKVDGLDSTDIVQTSGDQTIAGVKTFSSIPILPASDPTSDNEAVRKAYVDGKTTQLGTWETKSNNTVYQAQTDGFVVAYVVNSNGVPYLYGWTDSSNPPTTARLKMSGATNSTIGLCMPVRKNDYWKTTRGDNDAGGGTVIVYWIPLTS